MTWAEFQEVTLAQLEALEERRMVRLRHDRFNSAMIASLLINTHRTEGMDAVSPFDFISGFAEPEDEKSKLRRSIKHAIAVAFTQMKDKSAEAAQAEKARIIQRLTDGGIEDPEGLIREVFPEL